MKYNTCEFVNLIVESNLFDAKFFSFIFGIDDQFSRSELAEKYLSEEIYFSAATSRKFDGAKYLANYPDLKNIPALLHYEVFGKLENRSIFPYSVLSAIVDQEDINLIKESNFFDVNFYKERHMHNLRATAAQVAEHYLTYASLDCRSPSMQFDAARYYADYLDVELSGIPALLHYEKYGKYEVRNVHPVLQSFRSGFEVEKISNLERPIAEKKIAIVLHIFYPDFVEKFFRMIEQVPFEMDLFITTPLEEVEALVRGFVCRIPYAIGSCEIRVTKNCGRNFGPWLVEFSKKLTQYDYIGHVHSKKSLYSGREQIHWSSHTYSGVLNSPEYMESALNILERTDVNYVCAEPFYTIPFWAQHWLKNWEHGKKLGLLLGYDVNNGFLDYPVGGMFWVKVSAIKLLLEHDWNYEDFPQEDGQIDGTLHHAIERFIGVLCSKSGCKNAVWSPKHGEFRIGKELWRRGIESLSSSHALGCIASFETVSFDLFDTLIYRGAYSNEYARELVEGHPVKQKIIPKLSYIAQRRLAEESARVKARFKEVDETDIASMLAEICSISLYDAKILMDLEFELDLKLMKPRISVLSLYRESMKSGKNVIIVSDMYYSLNKIQCILNFCGISLPNRIYISSEVGKRKDSGEMWDYLRNIYGSFVHFGDNMVSDVQNSSERGILGMYIPSMYEKASLSGIVSSKVDEKSWGCIKDIINHYGESPFFS